MNASEQREEAVFEAALRLSGEERVAFLDKACAGDTDLRQRVEALLSAFERGSGFMKEPAVSTPTLSVSLQPTEKAGDRIGRYKLLEQIGEGGCGLVYVAEQEQPVRRRVALKIIKLGMDTKQVIARFDAERQALALMDHPNIAKVLDAGATEAGRPYFVMELVRGIKITDYSDQNRLSPRERLELFVQVCRAIQHAHQKGIIHRDIKPSNILVTLHDGIPVPKVIDFGIAKATQGRLTDQTVYTAFEQFIGTPAYMSPEQAEMSGLDIDTRSDIYSLGVLLYELLIGKTPFDPKELVAVGLDEMRRTIREKEPPRPSTRLSTMLEGELTTTAKRRHTEAPKLVHLMRGDLDWIVMKCLEKDRTRRYETANGLATDIGRHLNNEPVVARPPSALYRLQKLARRNKLIFTAGAAITIVLVLGVVISASQAIRATRAERQQARSRGLAEEASTRAKQQEQLALERAEQARRQEQRASQQELLARQRFYAAQMNLAMQAWESGQPASTLELLEGQRPKFDQEDFRCFEWYYLWQLCQGQCYAKLPTVDTDNSSTLAMSPDGRTFASAFNVTIRLRDVATGRLLQEFQGHQNQLTGIAFSPDGETLMSTDWSSVGKVWDLVAGKQRATLNAFGGVAFAGNSETAVSGGPGAVKIWNMTSGREEGNLGGKAEENFFPVAITPDGQTVAASGGPRTVVWAREGGSWHERGAITTGDWQVRVALSPDGLTLAHGGYNLTLYDAVTLKKRQILKGHNGFVLCIAFSGDGKNLITGGNDRTVRIWDTATGRQTGCLAHEGAVYAIALGPDETVLATLTTEALRLWNLTPITGPSVFGHSARLEVMAATPDGKMLAGAGVDGTIRIWDVSAGKEVQMIPGTGWPGGIAFAPDGNTLAIGQKGRIVLRNIAQRSDGFLEGHPQGAKGLAFSPDGGMLACADMDGRVVLWDMQSRQPKFTIPPMLDNGGPFQGVVAFAPDGKTVAAAGGSGIVRLFDSATGGEVAMLERLEEAWNTTYALGFSPNGEVLAAGDKIGIVRIWELPSGKLRACLKGHTDAIHSLDFSPDSRTLATGGRDHTIRLWDVASAQERVAWTGYQGTVKSVAFLEKGTILASGGNDSMVRLWRAAVSPEAKARKREVSSTDPDTPVARNELGDRLWQSGRTSEAESTYRAALTRLDKLVAKFPDDPLYQQEMIRSLLSLALLLEQQGASEEIVRARARARELYRKLSTDQQDTLVFSYRERHRKLSVGSPLQARRTLEQIVGIVGGDDRAWLRAGTTIVNNVASGLSPIAESVEFYEKVIECARRELADPSPVVGQLLVDFGDYLSEHGEPKEAIDQYVRCLPILRKQGGKNLAHALDHLGKALCTNGRTKDAEPYFKESSSIMQALAAAKTTLQQRAK